MTFLYNMKHLMDYHILKTFRIPFCQFRVKPQGLPLVITASPVSLHFSCVEFFYLYSQNIFPFFYNDSGSFFQNAAVPPVKNFLFFELRGKRADIHRQTSVSNHHFGISLAFNKFKFMSYTPNIHSRMVSQRAGQVGLVRRVFQKLLDRKSVV